VKKRRSGHEVEGLAAAASACLGRACSLVGQPMPSWCCRCRRMQTREYQMSGDLLASVKGRTGRSSQTGEAGKRSTAARGFRHVQDETFGGKCLECGGRSCLVGVR